MLNSKSISIGADWLPRPEAINAMPEPLRKYIHDLETNADPAGMVQENAILRAERDQLLVKLAELKAGRNG